MITRRLNNDVKRKVRTFFQKKKWKKVLTFLFFLLLAFGFWLLQYLQQKFEVDIVIPISYTNLPPELTVKDSIPDRLTMKVQDKGTILLNYFSRGNDPIEIDLKNIDPKTGVYRITRSSLEVEIYKRLVTTTKLLTFSPESINIDFTPLLQKEVPIQVNGNLKPALGFWIDTVELNPSSVMIMGEAENLDTINVVLTEEIKIENIGENFEKKLNLIRPNSKVRLDQKKINIHVFVEEYTEKIFSIPVQSVNTPDGFQVRFFPSDIEVICQLPLERYQDLKKEDLAIAIQYDSLLIDRQAVISVNLIKKPDYIKSYRLIPETIEFLIEQE